MKKLFPQQIFIISMLVLGLYSCVKRKEFPPQPSIEFLQFISYGKDSADCIISFKDGDGDIGILDGDNTSAPDFRMKYLYKSAGTGWVFKPWDADLSTPSVMDTLYYEYRVPDVTPEGQNKALEGEIKAKFRVPPIYHTSGITVKFEITLRDRAGNLSNKVSTNEIIVP